jgi:hypothetical protein
MDTRSPNTTDTRRQAINHQSRPTAHHIDATTGRTPHPLRTNLADALQPRRHPRSNVDTLLGPANGPQAGVIAVPPGSHREQLGVILYRQETHGIFLLHLSMRGFGFPDTCTRAQA